MSRFIFENYHFDSEAGEASFSYAFDDGRRFVEKASFKFNPGYDDAALQRALRLAFLLIGTSYFKTFPTPDITIGSVMIDEWTAAFLNKVYQEGLSQFAFENGLGRSGLAHFTANGQQEPAVAYEGDGIVALQSGGKDSLLTAALLQENGTDFVPWYVASSDHHPAVLDDVGRPLVVTRRTIDRG